MGRCQQRLNSVILRLCQNTLTPSKTYNSFNAWRIYQVCMAMIDLYNCFTSINNFKRVYGIWLGIDLVYVAIVQSFIVLIHKVGKATEAIGYASFLLFSFYHVELYLHLQSDAIIMMNVALEGIFNAILFSDTISSIIKALALHTLFYVYVTHAIICREVTDKLFIPEVSIMKYLLFCYLICAFPLYYVISLRYSNLKKKHILIKNIKSWEKVMGKINMGISIEGKNGVRYRNQGYCTLFESAQLSSQVFKEYDCKLGIPFIFQSNDLLYEITQDQIYFSDELCSIWFAHNVTSISKAEEAKYQHLLIATITHELRTPLNIMMAIFSMLKDGSIADNLKSLIYKGILAAQMQECLINDILDVAKINNGVIEINKQSSKIKNIICTIYEMFRIKIENHIQFSLNFVEPFPEVMVLDERRFKQIILNLLSNSAKFTSTGFITIESSFKDSMLVTTVSDSGVGIPKEENSKIFTKFGTIHANSSINKSGSGLGLNLCKKLCTLMGGDISFKSDPHVLTTFSFWIPTSIGDTIEPKEITIRIPTILHIDDDFLNICILNSYASKIGLVHYSYSLSEEAIAYLKKDHANCNIDIAFIDINMPHLNGYETAKRIRPILPSAKLYALTGEDRRSILEKCIESGFNDVIEKPISYDTYKATVGV